MADMFRERPWPFEGHRFPDDLGVAVMRTVLSDEARALEVTHFPDNSWGITDGGDPNVEDALTVTHLWHVLRLDPSLHVLALLPPGWVAVRDRRDGPWSLASFRWQDDPP